MRRDFDYGETTDERILREMRQMQHQSTSARTLANFILLIIVIGGGVALGVWIADHATETQRELIDEWVPSIEGNVEEDKDKED